MKAILAVVALLLAQVVAADELYVPLRGGVPVRIINLSSTSATVTVELIEAAAESPLKTSRVSIPHGGSIEWRDADAQFFGALRLSSDAPIEVASSAAVLDARDAIFEGALAASGQHGIGVVNPTDAAADVIVSLVRDERTIAESFVRIPARGIRLIRADRLFAATAEPDDTLAFRSARTVLPFAYDDRGVTRPTTTPRRKRRSVRHPAAPVQAVPRTVVLTASKDNTLHESGNGGTSNGKGPATFAGATAVRSLRRALIAFDVASQIPPGSQVTRVVLRMNVSATRGGVTPMRLHRVTKNWGEGNSTTFAGSGSPAQSGDATWLHSSFPGERWTRVGGDFNSAQDASANVGSEAAVWDSSAGMVARVQEWLDQPATNFGWIIIGNESTATTAKRFDSREGFSEATRPTLTVEFTTTAP